MILIASQRSGGQDLAAHLLNATDNEHVELHELRGFASDDLRGAFKEAEAVSRGTKCKQYLFSVSFSPPEAASVDRPAFEAAIDSVEQRLGLEGQPRAIVFHEKEGRRHAHCVWSRIDAEEMRAKALPFFKNKLTSLSRDLYLEHGWEMPRGLTSKLERDPTNFTLSEWQQAKRLGQDPRWIKSVLQDCWKRSDSAPALRSALEERGFHLAKGDRRGLVVIGHDGDVHSLPRALGLKTKEVRDRLGDGERLGSVADTQSLIGHRLAPAMRRHIEASRDQFRERSAKLGAYKEAVTRQHREARVALDGKQAAQREVETKARAAAMPRGLSSLWSRITGRYKKTLAEHEREAAKTRQAQEAERQRLIDAQREQRARLQLLFKELRGRQAEQLLTLRREVGRYLAFSRGAEPGRDTGREASRATHRQAERGPGLGLGLER